jgi:hypothetical protein
MARSRASTSVRHGGGPVTMGRGRVRVGGTNEVQTVTSTATGGSIKLTLFGFTTASIAFNATATAVRDALVTALAPMGIATADIGASGGPLGTSAVTLTFQGKLGRGNVPQLTVDNSLATGGTATPATQTGGGTSYGPTPDSFNSFAQPGSSSNPGIPFFHDPTDA